MTDNITILGLDLSLTATGVALGDIEPHVYKPAHKIPMIRLSEFRNWITGTLANNSVSMAVIENYAYGAQYQREVLGELHGIIRLALYDAKVPFALVPPSTLKQFATGKGNAGKDAMVATAARCGCTADDNNAVDAWWLQKMAQEKFNLYGRIFQLPKAQRDIVDKVDWPMRFAS